AGFDLPGHFRLEIRVADVQRRDRRSTAGTDRRPVRLHRREDVGLLTSLTPRGPQLQGRDQGRVREERLYGDDPRGADLRIDDEVEIGTEGAVVVAPHRAGQEQPVLPGNLFLDVDAQGLVLVVE